MSQHTAVSPVRAKRRANTRQWLETLDAYSMLLPTILGLLIFFALPLGISFYYSFTDLKFFNTPQLIGLDQYRKVFADDKFWQATTNIVLFSAATLVLATVPALVLAVIMNEKLRGQSFFRALYFVPVVASVVAVSLLWRYLLNVDFGFANQVLKAVGIAPVPWLTSPDFGLISVILVFSWRTIGYNMVILLSGLQSIPRPLYEAATVDGAGRWRQFLNITLPMLSPTTFFVLITTLINCLQIFDVPFALGWTRSNTAGPADSMLTNVFLLYREGFIKQKMGYASSLAWVLFVMIMAITFVQFRVSNRWVNYE